MTSTKVLSLLERGALIVFEVRYSPDGRSVIHFTFVDEECTKFHHFKASLPEHISEQLSDTLCDVISLLKDDEVIARLGS